MAKVIDRDGTWRFMGNPITKECVRPYLGKNIDPDGSMGLEPDKIYNVYRPWSELSKQEALETFNGKPFRNEHEMVGTVEGITSTDDTQVGGSIYNARPAEDGSHTIVADLTIFSKDIQDLIASGKKELSLGYFCDYRRQDGVFDGQHYDFVQCDIEGNHIALVERGRMGRDVRVFDKAITFDSMEIPEMKKSKDEDTKKSELRDEVAELLNSASDEQLTEIKKLISEKDEDETKKSADEDEPKKDGKDEDDPNKGCDENKPDKAKDEDDPNKSEEDEDEDKKPANKDEEEKKNGSDKEDEPKKGKDKCSDEDDPSKKKVEDSAIKTMTMDEAIHEVTLRDEIYGLVKPLIGDFDKSRMSSRQIARYACDKLDIDCGSFTEVDILDAYLTGLEKGKTFKYGMDSGTGVLKKSSALEQYLKD